MLHYLCHFILLKLGFIYYVVLVVAVAICVAAYIVPRYGNTYVAVYIYICASIGSLSVMCCKGLGLAIREALSGQRPFLNLISILFLAALIICITVQVRELCTTPALLFVDALCFVLDELLEQIARHFQYRSRQSAVLRFLHHFSHCGLVHFIRRMALYDAGRRAVHFDRTARYHYCSLYVERLQRCANFLNGSLLVQEWISDFKKLLV